MAYGAFTEATNGTIAERKYSVADQITTTAVTSCMIVVAKVSGKLFGIHLSIFGETGGQFLDEDADAVLSIMNRKGADVRSVHLFGELDFWGNENAPGYGRLMELLQHPSASRQHQKAGVFTITSADVS
jgi:hypothetical protein